MDSSSSGKSCTLESDLDHDIVFSDRYIPSRAGFNVELGCTVMDGQGSDLDGNHSGERERDFFINEIFHIYISLISTCETRRFSMY